MTEWPGDVELRSYCQYIGYLSSEIKGQRQPTENLELWASWHKSGQRVEDLVEFVVNNYPEYVTAALENRAQLRLGG